MDNAFWTASGHFFSEIKKRGDMTGGQVLMEVRESGTVRDDEWEARTEIRIVVSGGMVETVFLMIV